MAGMTLARVRGVPVRLHASLLLTLPALAYVAATHLLPGGGWAAGAAFALGLLPSVAAHEAAHVWVALEAGAEPHEVVLLPVGGVTAWERSPRDPRMGWRIALAGPLASAGLALLLFGAAASGVPLAAPLAWMNVALAALNLLPAHPLDGGPLLRGLLEPSLGAARAARACAWTGRAAALALAAWGILADLWVLVALAAFVHVGADREDRALAVARALGGLRVGDVMTRPAATLPPGATLEWARERMVATRRRALPVVVDRRPVGVLRLEDAERVDEADRWWTPAGILAQRDVHTFTPWEEGAEAARRLGASGVGLVVDQEGRLLGMVEGADLARLTQGHGGRRRGQAGGKEGR